VKFIFPPRPKGNLPPGQLAKYDATGDWVAQNKFNGHRALVHILPNGKIEFFNRHGGLLRLSNEPQLKVEFSTFKFKPDTEYWLDGESFYGRLTDPRFRDKIVLYDILFAGKYLFRVNQMERLRQLFEICGEYSVGDIAYKATEHIYVAEVFGSDFENLYKKAAGTEVLEGLVLRKRNSVLDNFGTKEYEVPWLIRCRRL